MSQGYLLRLTIDATPVQFQNVDVDVDGDDLDTSASINPDGTFNAGLADIDPDLLVATVSIDTVIKDARVLAMMAAFVPKRKYDALWSAVYGARTYGGRGLYVMHHRIRGRIPGDARLQMTFRSIQGYSNNPLVNSGVAGYVTLS